MPDHDSTALLSRQTKRRRVDIGVKRTVGTASAFFAKARATFFSAMNPQGSEQDVEYSVVQHADGEKSNVLRKLLKRANSYEDAMMPFPGATIISQLLKNNMNKNGGTEPSFQASGLSSTGSEVHQEDVCSNSSRDSPQECLSPFGRPAMSQFDMDRLCDEHLRAKRARVENIIRGMSHSPSVALRGNENEREMAPQSQQSFQQLVSARKEQKREERRQLKQQLEDMQKQLRQLQEKSVTQSLEKDVKHHSSRRSPKCFTNCLYRDHSPTTEMQPPPWWNATAILGQQHHTTVDFNRCITSQLIKWFSNFREFYYIQMEKYARQAINDGVTSTEELSITRDCELYRALNMHYNKANDFEQVPERFLEVAQITLREFFNAIIAGKDVDPSWKKAIYKVICKLDSEVPEIFKSPNCLQELLHE
ncbi:unnamed protein product [Eretmochelys imbricata]